jgi:hypothetical protein
MIVVLRVSSVSGLHPFGAVMEQNSAARLWRRKLDTYLGIVVATSVVLYYELYVMFGVSTSIIAHYGMTFRYFLWINIVILVAAPALVRDFSPQFGRGTAMAFWVLGPILGSLATTAIVSATFKGSTTWQAELRYSGVAGLVVFVVALVGLRELAPRLRDQIMVSLRDRALIEARAQGKEAAPALAVIDAHPRLFAQLDAYPPTAVPPALARQAVQEVGPANLALVQRAHPALTLLQQHGAEVRKAAADVGGQWRTWWWVCLGGQAVLLPFVFVMSGRWRPRRARADEATHRVNVARELAALTPGVIGDAVSEM